MGAILGAEPSLDNGPMNALVLDSPAQSIMTICFHYSEVNQSGVFSFNTMNRLRHSLRKILLRFMATQRLPEHYLSQSWSPVSQCATDSKDRNLRIMTQRKYSVNKKHIELPWATVRLGLREVWALRFGSRERKETRGAGDLQEVDLDEFQTIRADMVLRFEWGMLPTCDWILGLKSVALFGGVAYHVESEVYIKEIHHRAEVCVC